MTLRSSSKTRLKTLLVYGAVGTILLIIAVLLMAILQWLGSSGVSILPGCRMRAWVKIVNQQGKPVGGYNLEVRSWVAESNPMAEPKEVSTWLVSGKDGVICYDSQKRIKRAFFGGSLAENGKNPDYLCSYDDATLSCSDMQGGSPRVGRVESPRVGLAAANPIMVHVYKHGPPQSLLRVEHRAYDLKSGSQYVAVDVLRGTMWLADRPEGDISIREVSPADYARLISADRLPSFPGIEIVAAKDAGLQPVNDHYLVEPPETGYKQQLLFERDWEQVKIRPGGIQFYFFCRNRACYGYLNMNRTNSFLYIANITGERNLYYEGYPSTSTHAMKNHITPPVELPHK